MRVPIFPFQLVNRMTSTSPRHRVAQNRQNVTRPILAAAVACTVLAFAAQSREETSENSPQLAWKSLPPIPDRNGFASPFAGVNYGARNRCWRFKFPR